MAGQYQRFAFIFLLVGCCAAPTLGSELARVNGKAITDQDIQMLLSGMNDGQRESLLKDPNTRSQILARAIDQEVLTEEAEKEKLDQGKDFKEALTAFKRQYLANRLLEKNINNKVTDGAARKFYEEHKERFTSDEVHVQHILLPTEAQAMDVLKMTRAPGADFQALAEKYSKDPSAKNNRGDLGFVTRDRLVPEFTEKAFGANAGEIVGPVKTAYGYHIIKVIARKPGRPFGYDEVELKVKNQLRRELAESYLAKLKRQAKIQVNE